MATTRAKIQNVVTDSCEDSLGATCSPSSNRLVRTRMLGGVGAGRGNPPGYPISALPR